MLFKDRFDAGEKLGIFLKNYIPKSNNYIILFIPRGGLPIAKKVSEVLDTPYFPLIVKKLSPLNMEEYGFGAMAPDGSMIYDEKYMKYLGVDESKFKLIKQKVFSEIQDRIRKYSFGKLPNVKGKNVIIIDDGVATGYTAAVAGIWSKKNGANKVILASPVCPIDVDIRLKDFFDEIYCLYKMQNFQAVGQYYEDFHQIDDDEYFSLIK